MTCAPFTAHNVQAGFDVLHMWAAKYFQLFSETCRFQATVARGDSSCSTGPTSTTISTIPLTTNTLQKAATLKTETQLCTRPPSPPCPSSLRKDITLPWVSCQPVSWLYVCVCVCERNGHEGVASPAVRGHFKKRPKLAVFQMESLVLC